MDYAPVTGFELLLKAYTESSALYTLAAKLNTERNN